MTIIVPAFHRYLKEGAIIGRMLLGYSELELMLALSVSLAVDAEQDDLMRAIFRTRSESGRLQLADALLKSPLKKLELGPVFGDVKGNMTCCISIRNNYSHCQWADTDKGLFWSNLDDAARTGEGFNPEYKHVDLILLELQESFFVHTRELLFYLEHEIKKRKGTVRVNPWKRPARLSKPPEYNSEVKYSLTDR